VDRNALLIGTFASLGPHGDAGLLLTAFEKVKSERSLTLVCLGKSGLRPERRAGSQKGNQSAGEGSGDIIWTGPLPHPEVSRLMATCDVFVLPYLDGISSRRTTLAAALLHGLPVLTTRGKQADAMFVHRENIYLVPLGDAQAFADGLMELARCPELRTRLALGARALHAARFSWHTIARQVVRLA
jgi:glycosyltransferase involved in cell wall biosynthesis